MTRQEHPSCDRIRRLLAQLQTDFERFERENIFLRGLLVELDKWVDDLRSAQAAGEHVQPARERLCGETAIVVSRFRIREAGTAKGPKP